MARTKVYISDQLIIRACNSDPFGIVARDMNKTMKRIKLRAIRYAPRNEVMDAMHRGGVVGTYQRSFRTNKRPSNQHIVTRTVYNIAPHARFVERGRRSTRFNPGSRGRYEKFTWTATGGQLIELPGTRGRKGQHVLQRAWAEETAKYGAGGFVRGSYARI